MFITLGDIRFNVNNINYYCMKKSSTGVNLVVVMNNGMERSVSQDRDEGSAYAMMRMLDDVLGSDDVFNVSYQQFLDELTLWDKLCIYCDKLYHKAFNKRRIA